jgi:hypothetical protein
MPSGRLLEDLSSLPKDWYKSVLELYEKGASDVEVKALIYKWRGSFSNDLWDRWMKDEPIFSETIKAGKLLAEAWWNKNGRENLKDKEFNYTGWYMQMKNRYGWTDRVSNDHTTGGDKINIPLIEWVKTANQTDDE